MINFEKMREFQKEIDESARKEYLENIKSEFINFIQTEFFKETFIKLKERKELNPSSRVINNWVQAGLIDGDEGKWRKYNKVDGIWLEIVSRLREFGFSLEKIKEVKEQLYKSKLKRFTPIEYIIMYSILKESMILLVYGDGRINVMSKRKYIDTISLLETPPHIYFDILSMIIKEFPNNKFDSFDIDKNVDKLSDEELKLFYFIRSGDYDNIKIHTKSGEIIFIEAERTVELPAKVVDIIKNKGYQDINIKTQQGNIVTMKVTEKTKFKNK